MVKKYVIGRDAHFHLNILMILTTVFGLQMLRMLFPSFVGFLRDSVGFSSITLAPIALILFSLVLLAGPLFKVIRTRLFIIFTAGGLVVVRLIEQLSTSAQYDLVLSSMGVVFFLFLLPMAYCLSRSWKNEGAINFGIYLLLGVAFDTALLAGFSTLDLSWQGGVVPILIVFFIGLTLVVNLYLLSSSINETPEDGNWNSNLSLISIGPWLFLQMIVFQSIPRLSALTGFETPAAAMVVILGNAAAIFLIARIVNRKSNFFVSIFAGALLLVSLLIPLQANILTVFLFLVGQISCAVLFVFIFQGTHNESRKEGITTVSILFWIGYLLFILLIFLYYLTFDIDLGFRAKTLLPFASIMLAFSAIYASQKNRRGEGMVIHYTAAGILFLLILVPLSLQLVWKSPEYTQPDPKNQTLKVLTYNLHDGFNTDGRLDLETLAKIIESSSADVVALQEVSRGWLIWGGVDMLTWLSQRLNMPYVSGPTADPQWGNAILSRYPLKNIQFKQLPTDDLLIQRGFIQADIDVGSGKINLIVTHFYHLDEKPEIRVLQSEEIIRNIQPDKPTILVGDLNATPDAQEMRILENSGMVDLASVLGNPPTYTYYSAAPYEQIDYIWISNGLKADHFNITNTTASDHFPVFSNISMR